MMDPRQEGHRAHRRSNGGRPRSAVRPRPPVVVPRPRPAAAGRVLLVVESDATRKRLASSLRAAGLEVMETRSAQEALERTAGADLAVVDLELTGSSAPFLIEDLLRRDPGVYAIMLGGDPDAARVGYRAGADNWVRARAVPLDVARLVVRSLGHARAKRVRAAAAVPLPRRIFHRSALWVSLAGAVCGALLAWAVHAGLSYQEVEEARLERLIRALEQAKPAPPPPVAPAKSEP